MLPTGGACTKRERPSNSPALGAGEYEVCSPSRRIQCGLLQIFSEFLSYGFGAKCAARFAKRVSANHRLNNHISTVSTMLTMIEVTSGK